MRDPQSPPGANFATRLACAAFVSALLSQPTLTFASEPTDEELRTILRTGEAGNSVIVDSLREIGLTNPQRLAHFLKDPQLEGAAMQALHSWPGDTSFTPEMLRDIKAIAEKRGTRYWTQAYYIWLRRSPLPDALDHVENMIQKGPNSELPIAVTFVRILGGSGRGEAVDARRKEALIKSVFDRYEQIVATPLRPAGAPVNLSPEEQAKLQARARSKFEGFRAIYSLYGPPFNEPQHSTRLLKIRIEFLSKFDDFSSREFQDAMHTQIAATIKDSGADPDVVTQAFAGWIAEENPQQVERLTEILKGILQSTNDPQSQAIIRGILSAPQ